MKIVIPMSGKGQRFLNAGYSQIKPLIEVEGKPIIEHVINMFPGESTFVFICNREHLASTPLQKILLACQPEAEIVAIEPHHLGPVHAVLQAVKWIADEEPVIVNYCDFSVSWDYSDFKATVENNGCDGCVPAYIGFHPHLLRPGLYAGMRVDAQKTMLEIREKYSFTKNTMDCHQSAGTYYFKNGHFVKRFFKELVDRQIHTNGEYYVSMVYHLMQEAGLHITAYELEHFLQWGTPDDLEDYLYWSGYFRKALSLERAT